ncbi:MAG: GNAT family N-acetyltransferase [bacterium]
MTRENKSTTNAKSVIEQLSNFIRCDDARLSMPEIEKLLQKLVFNETALKALISSEGIDFLFQLAATLLRKYKISQNDIKNSIKHLLNKFLDMSRVNFLLQQIDQENKGQAWFYLLLSIIRETHFTTGRLFQQRKNLYAQKTLFRVLNNHKSKDYSWQEIDEKVNQMARALLAYSRQSSEPCIFAVLSENSLEIACLDLACLCSGQINVLIPANSITSQVEYILNHSKAQILFVSNDEQLGKVQTCRSHLKYLKHLIILQPGSEFKNDDVLIFTEFLQAAESVSQQEIEQAMKNVKIDDLATIMYTSGTTETPKGIMFTQLNIVSKRFARAIALPEISDKDVFLCYLPLFHTFGRFFEMMGCLFWGSTYVFMENPKLETMLENFQKVKPTVFISIPKKWMQIYDKLQEKIDIHSASTSEIQHQLAKLTGGKLRWGLSAAGYLDPDIFKFFQRNGLELMSGFGMTEATGGITMTPPSQYRDNSVGKALPGIEIMLAEDGEMWVRGPYVMKGYLEDSTSGIKDGWFHTGDIFSVDQEGFYEILDRKKDIYKNIRGESIAPQKIENMFLDFESVKQVFLVGDHRPYNTLLIYPNYDYDQLDYASMSPEEIREFFNSLIVSVNRFLAPFERIVNFSIIEREFDPKRGELTAKGTFKRKVVEDHFKDVIKEMYRKYYQCFLVDDFEIRIPNWFLREQGLTAEDLKLKEHTLVVKPGNRKLRIAVQAGEPNQICVGNFLYTTKLKYVDLGATMSNPILWLGNIDFVNFVGDSIFNLTHATTNLLSDLQYDIQCEKCQISDLEEKKYQRFLEHNIKDIQGIHYSAYILNTLDKSKITAAMRYLESIVQDKNEQLATLAMLILLRLSNYEEGRIKKQAFQVLISNAKGELFETVLKRFLYTAKPSVDDDSIAEISEIELSKQQIYIFFKLLEKYLKQTTPPSDVKSKNFILYMLNFLTSYGIAHPIWFKSIRTELIKWSISESDDTITSYAKSCYERLQTKFREWLGPNQRIAVDRETAQEYRWQDVITFEEALDESDQNKIFQAIQKTSLLREAIFLFSRGTLLRLQDIPHKGIWVSFLGALHGKTVYRVSVQTRHYGAFDLALNLRKTLSVEEVESEITWLICAGASEDRSPLVEDFGGYWPEYDLWTEEFIPGDTVEKFLKRLARHPEAEWVDRMQLIWPYFAWSGLSAYVDFWNRTSRTLEIADPKPANVIVPSHDYQVGFRIVSISHRKPFESISKMILSFRHNFIDSVENSYEKLKGKCRWSVIFSAFLEVLGEKEGTRILEQSLLENKNTLSEADHKLLKQKLTNFLETVHEKGFLPNRLHFAIQRYSRWMQLNPAATPQAKMQTLQDLHNTYMLEKLEKEYPGARVQLFRDTIFQNSHQKIHHGLNEIVRKIKNNDLSDDKLLEKIAALRNRVKFSTEEEFFLARMTYPHLSPTDSAQLISLASEGMQKTDLVLFIEDHDGNEVSIRHPATPKEIARLHRLFKIAKLPVQFQPDHKYLVALNENSQVIGGLFYRPTDTEHTHLEKIVVEERHRKKGVSDGLLREFFNRIQSQGITTVTVGFLRPEYFYKFGFKIDHRYGNMVKKLKPPTPKEVSDDFVEAI